MTVAAPALDGQVVLVTGAGGGIGSAIARAVAAAGATPFLVDRDPGVADVAGGLGAPWLCVDLTTAGAAEEVVRTATATCGGLHGLVTVAGTQWRGEATAIPEDSWARLLEVNLSSTYRLIRHAVPHLRATRGSIVAISSMSADRAVPGIVPYGSTKAALNHLCRGLAVELGPVGVRVNAVAPGYVDTPMTAELLADPAFRAAKLSRIPLGRLADGDDVADPVVFLLSSAARYVTGVCLAVDGGYATT
jgi:3-oxoacyl-[acyl-carrier protein] reductase